MDYLEQLKKYNNLYLTIIMRYKEYIEENENVYMAELPRLITPEDSPIVAAVEGIKSNFNPYSFEANIEAAEKEAYSYVVKNICSLEMPIQFWQLPRDAIMNGAGDAFDRACVLCSMLVCLGDLSSRILVMANESERKVIVYSEANSRITAFDFDHGIKTFKAFEEMKDYFALKSSNEPSIYEFNDKLFRNIE
jgi:hypothetical protein